MRQHPGKSLRERADDIRLSATTIARATGLHRITVQRILSGSRKAIAANIGKVERAIEAEERAVLSRLIDAACVEAIERRA